MKHFKLFISILVLLITAMPGAYAQVWPKPKVVVIPLLGDGSTWAGPWAESTDYKRSDIVEFDGSSYIALSSHVSNLGNIPPEPAIWDLVAASGATGNQGPIGETGPKGDIGIKGDKGDIGMTGPKGDTGVMGSIGPVGATGMAGPTGAQGVKGDAGVIGPKGDIGATGPRGVMGDIGMTGPKGDAGVMGSTGPVGATGMTGPKGDVGARGGIGPVGATGMMGPTGAQGPKGDTGATGLNGGTIVYTGVAPIIVDNTNSTISFQQPALDNMQPSLALNYICALQGIYPSRNWSEATLGQVSLFAGNFAPRGWALCNGQLLPIAQNAALFSLLGTIYGGDGRTTFALPDLRGRVVMGAGNGPGLSPRRVGERLGQETIR